MKKRKYVKVSVDMFENRKLKLIENMEKRDIIEVVWIKLLLEATKINDEGLVYLERDIPYTVEMLSIILGRSKEDIELALKVLIDLKMIIFNKDNSIRVCSWSEHNETRKRVYKKENSSGEIKDYINIDLKKENDIIKHNKDDCNLEYTSSKIPKKSYVF